VGREVSVSRISKEKKREKTRAKTAGVEKTEGLTGAGETFEANS